MELLSFILLLVILLGPFWLIFHVRKKSVVTVWLR